jgi:lysophospholipase L1-like esterase
MSRAEAARRLASAAAFGGGSTVVVGGSLYGILLAEARLARRRIGPALEEVPDPSGIYGAWRRGPVIRLAVLGDSGAAGYGAQTPKETFGAFLATGLSELADRPVFLRSVPVVGAKTADLATQIPRALAALPDVCAIIIGTNDVTHQVLPWHSVRRLKESVARLRASGVGVVVGTCPDLGTLRPVPPPLRQIARVWSRRLAAAQTIATVEAGGRSVSLGSILGPEFAASPLDLFGPDQFHPSPAGYRSCAAAMLPTVAAAAGLVTDESDRPEAARGEGFYSLASAAAAAAEASGTEVSQVDGDSGGGDRPGAAGRGGRGRWVLLRHRRRHIIPEVGDIEPEAADAGLDQQAS